MRTVPNQIGAPARKAQVWAAKADGSLPFTVRAIYCHTDVTLDWEAVDGGGRHTTPFLEGALICIEPKAIYDTATTGTYEIWG
jgi:hypothetical protein